MARQNVPSNRLPNLAKRRSNEPIQLGARATSPWSGAERRELGRDGQLGAKGRLVSRRRRATPHHSVYVIHLDLAVLKIGRFRARNPHYIEGKACYYVGMTGLPVSERFANHRRGYKSNVFVKRFGRRLAWRMFQHLNPMTFERAKAWEVRLAEALRSRGYAVWQA